MNKINNLKLSIVYDTVVSYLLHLSKAVVCFTDFCFALHNCSNARVRYKGTCGILMLVG